MQILFGEKFKITYSWRDCEKIMITTKEELILVYLDSPQKVMEHIERRQIKRSDSIRRTLCDFGNAQLVYYYALWIDKGPHPSTRRSCLSDSDYAQLYAEEIDKCPRDDTRKAACKEAHAAYWYAKEVDKKPRDDTRKAACQVSRFSYWYAMDLDGEPRDDTRKAACKEVYAGKLYKLWERKLKREKK